MALKKIELVSKEELDNRLKASLEQRQMSDCFLYLGDSGVRNWRSLSSSREYPIASRLTELLRQNLPSIARHLSGRFDVVSIGVGSGEKERVLLEAIMPRCALTYYAVDISSEMVDEALNTVADIDVKKTGVVAFMEDLALLRQFWKSPVLLCLLGSNFCNYDPDYLLELVHSQLESDDLFLFDCHLFPVQHGSEELGREHVERVYHSQLNMLFNIGPLVQRGLQPDNCAFHLDLVPTETAVGTVYRTHKWLEIFKDTMISCGPNRVLLAAGDTIRLDFTYKYTRKQVQDYLQRHDFQHVELFLSPDTENMLTLVRKRPLSSNTGT